MNSRAWVSLGASVFLAALLQFFAAEAGLWIGLALALSLPALMLGAARYFESEPRLWAPMLASILGVAPAFAAAPHDPLLWTCPAAALALTASLTWWRTRDSRRCALCNGRIAGKVAFTCPRCGLMVCEARCWDFDRLRCRLCVQNRVPAFPADGRWWDRNFGAATQHGRCQMCQAGADETELRNCPKCGRAQCRECWDDANGACSRCRWVLPALPEALKQFV